MQFTQRCVVGLVIGWLAVLPLPGFGQMTPSHAPPNTEHAKRIEGTVVRIDGNELLLKATGGTTETYQLAPALEIIRSRPGQISDLSSGKLVGCTNLYGQSEKMVAEKCQVFSAGMHASTDSSQISGMITDVKVDAATQGNGHRIWLQISRKEGVVTMAASSVTVVSLLSPGDAAALKPGAKVNGIAQQAVDGTGVLQTLIVLVAAFTKQQGPR